MCENHNVETKTYEKERSYDFSMIVGYEDEKKQMKLIRNMLINFDEYKRTGIRIPRGVLLHGPAGVGKTALASSIATDEINVVRIRTIDCCDDEQQELIHNSFKIAKENQPAIILIDELDKIANMEKMFISNDNESVNKILLYELDQLDYDDRVIVVGTCNQLVTIGTALMRSGRFDRQIYVKLPDIETRKKIINYYLDKITLEKKIDLNKFAKMTSGFSGAKIECTINECAISAFEDNRDCITDKDVNEVINKLIFHTASANTVINEETEREIAIHEGGHALIGAILFPTRLHEASVLSQGNTGGHVSLVPDENSLSVNDLEKQIMTALGGFIAEREFLGITHSGGIDDLKKVFKFTSMLFTDFCAYGYDYQAVSSSGLGEMTLSEKRRYELETEVSKKVDEFDKKVTEILHTEEESFMKIVKLLKRKKVVSGKEIHKVVYGGIVRNKEFVEEAKNKNEDTKNIIKESNKVA